YSDAIGADRYRVLITTFAPEGTRAFVLDRQSDELKGKTAEELKKRLWLLEKYAQSQKNINITPLSKDKHHILIDDLTAEKLAQLKTDGYRPACVIESSPGNFQAILNVPSEGSPEAANQLAKVLNEKYGDPKLSGAVHAHRLPPFANFKPKHQKGDGSFPETRLIEADGGLCHKATEQLKELAKRFKWEKQRLRAQANFDKMDTSGDPHAAYWAHYEDIAGRFKGALDYSQVDGMIGIRMRVTGYSPDQVRDAIEQNAPAMRQKNMTESEFREKYQYRNWKLFAQETTEKFVFGPRGAVQFGKAEAYRPYFMKLEGRDSTQQGRDDTKKKREGLER
ncbi:MAG: hypothetical protein GX256_01450, partial [Fretibacterium sp.]|nr:hypothetical protein [Fretibacterium sp.]